MERIVRQQAQELMPQLQTVGHITHVLEAQAANEEVQWQRMLMWMQEREQKWDTHHEDKKLQGVAITYVIAKVMKSVAPGQVAREKERDKTVKMNGGGLEDSQHADTMLPGGPEKRQQLQQQPMAQQLLKLQRKVQYEPKQMLAPTPARR